MLQRLAAAYVLSLTLAAAALAQDQSGAVEPAEAPEAPPAEASPPADSPAISDHHTRALIDALGDDATRSRLIEALEQSVAETPVAPAGAPALPPSQESTGRVHQSSGSGDEAPLPPSIGDRVLEAAPKVASGLVSDLREDFHEIRTTFYRLGALGQIRPQDALEIGVNLAIMFAVAFAVSLGGRRALLPLIRRFGDAAQAGGLGHRIALTGLSILLELVVLAVATAATTIAMSFLFEEDDTASYPIYFLVAFMLAGFFAIGARAIFSPSASHLRPIPLDDEAARYWCRHFVALLGLVTFGEILVSEVVRELTGPITANAATVALHLVGVAYISALILMNRRKPYEMLQRMAAESPDGVALPILTGLARYWHYPALLFLLLLVHQAFTTGDSALPQLLAAGLLVLSLALTFYIISALDRVADRGVRLSDEMNRAMPNLSARLNAFVPAFLRFLRYVVFMVWAGFALDYLGWARPTAWFEDRYGVDFTSAATSIVIIVLVGYAAWLAVTSWIDYRLTPVHGVQPTARQQTLYSLLRNAALVGILLIGLTYALSSIGISVAPLLASAGVVGLAIGFGSQKLVQDIINGLFIQFENAINVGDVVELAGKIGVVEKLTIRSVSLRDVQGVLHVIPFSSVDAVSNHMKGYSYHVADIGVAYGADLDAAKDEMLAAYDDLSNDYEWGAKLLGGIEWFGVETLGQSSVMLRARLKTRPGEQWGIGRAYAERVKRRFDARGIEIPFPQMKLWLDPAGEGKLPRPVAPLAPRHSLSHEGPTDASNDGDGGDGGDAPGDSR